MNENNFNPNNDRRGNNFDFLRFFLSFTVVIGHLIIVSGIDNFKQYQPFVNSYASVTAFFIISGFLITSSYIRTKSIKSYFKKRAQRLLPAYIFVIITCTLLLSFVSRYSLIDYFSNIQLYKYFLANISFLNFIEPCLPGVFLHDKLTCDVNGALWTIKIEVGFYLLIPILINWIEKINKKYILFIIIYILAVVYKSSLEYVGNTTDLNLFRILSRQLPGFMSYFICGISCYYYYNYFIKYKSKLFIVGLIVFLLEQKLGFEVFTPIALSLIIFSIAFSLKQLNNFAKFGDISYGIYIFHLPILKTAVYLNVYNRNNPYLIATILIIIVLFVGFLSWHLLEKRFLNRRRIKFYEDSKTYLSK